jgi:hypothetical protein
VIMTETEVFGKSGGSACLARDSALLELVVRVLLMLPPLLEFTILVLLVLPVALTAVEVPRFVLRHR